MEFRSGFGNLNSFVLESLRGIDETIQYGQGKKRKAQISEKSIQLGKMQKDLNRMEAMQRAVTDLVILCCSFGMFFLMYHLYQAGNVTFDAMLLATIAMMGSFGPVTALSSLSNNLNQTLASGERVLSLLEEEPMVEEIEGEVALSFEGASVEDVTFAYDEEIILKDCNINMSQGKVIGICGKSGCGKSTLLNILGLLDNPNSGECWLDGEPVARLKEKERTRYRRGRIGFVFQSFNLIDELTVEENVDLQLRYMGVPAKERRERVTEILRKVAMSHRAKHYPQQLSGGQQQRVAIARAVVGKPKLILADEPTGNLDSKSGLAVMELLAQLNAEGTTIVMVTHSQHDAQMASRIINLFDGQVVDNNNIL